MNKLSKNIIVIYHGDCPDGFGGAWAAWKKFGDEAEYIPAHYGERVIGGLEGKEIYCIDFVYEELNEATIKELTDKNKRFTIIDHHVSVEKITKLSQEYSYALDHSGAVLAWKYFHKDKPVPELLQYVEDGDLWKNILPDSIALVTYIDSTDYDFEVWDKLATDMADRNKRMSFIEKGEFMVNYKNEIIKRIIEENAQIVEFEGHKVYAINAPHEFASVIGHFLYIKQPPFSISWTEDRTGIHVSLRSDDSVDVSKIAGKFGGGGHKTSAGFRLNAVNSFPWKKTN